MHSSVCSGISFIQGSHIPDYQRDIAWSAKSITQILGFSRDQFDLPVKRFMLRAANDVVFPIYLLLTGRRDTTFNKTHWCIGALV